MPLLRFCFQMFEMYNLIGLFGAILVMVLKRLKEVWTERVSLDCPSLYVNGLSCTKVCA
jgi:hypothetical protein